MVAVRSHGLYLLPDLRNIPYPELLLGIHLAKGTAVPAAAHRRLEDERPGLAGRAEEGLTIAQRKIHFQLNILFNLKFNQLKI